MRRDSDTVYVDRYSGMAHGAEVNIIVCACINLGQESVPTLSYPPLTDSNRIVF